MLESIQELGDSVSHAQIKELRSALGDDLFSLLDLAFDSDTEEEAKERIDAFVSSAKKNVLKIFKARKVLDKDQTRLIMEFLEGDEQ
jgi:hypothetical protein